MQAGRPWAKEAGEAGAGLTVGSHCAPLPHSVPPTARGLRTQVGQEGSGQARRDEAPGRKEGRLLAFPGLSVPFRGVWGRLWSSRGERGTGQPRAHRHSSGPSGAEGLPFPCEVSPFGGRATSFLAFDTELVVNPWHPMRHGARGRRWSAVRPRGAPLRGQCGHPSPHGRARARPAPRLSSPRPSLPWVACSSWWHAAVTDGRDGQGKERGEGGAQETLVAVRRTGRRPE